MPGHYHSVVRIVFPDDREMWDFVGRRGSVQDQEKGRGSGREAPKAVEEVSESSGVRQLQEVFGGKLPVGMPIWAKKKIRRDLYEILTNSIQLRRHGTRRIANYAEQTECRGSDLQEEQSRSFEAAAAKTSHDRAQLTGIKEGEIMPSGHGMPTDLRSCSGPRWRRPIRAAGAAHAHRRIGRG